MIDGNTFFLLKNVKTFLRNVFINNVMGEFTGSIRCFDKYFLILYTFMCTIIIFLHSLNACTYKLLIQFCLNSGDPSYFLLIYILQIMFQLSLLSAHNFYYISTYGLKIRENASTLSSWCHDFAIYRLGCQNRLDKTAHDIL